MRKARELLLLFKMCKLAEKPVLAMGAGMAQLVYYCATRGRSLQVINGHEKGGALNQIVEVLGGDTDKLGQLDPVNHVFLDSLSGDYYTYNKDNQEWRPEGNTGLHYARAEASLQGAVVGGAADLVKRVRAFEGKPDDQGPVLIYSSAGDTKCSIRKEYSNHWIFEDLPHKEFMVENWNSWDSHPLNIRTGDLKTVQATYTILAVAAKRPQVVEHYNTVCT